MVGNFRIDKGHRFLLDAAVRVQREIPEVRFVLVGLGPLEEDVRSRTRELSLERSVVFAGYREDAPRIAGASDVFVLPSVQEGLPIALLEAMVQGIPPVVTRVGGVPEVVRDKLDGLVVAPGDPDSLAEGILALIRDPSRRRVLGASARQRAIGFDIRRTVVRIEEIYEELLVARDS
jgi:glycosyltransferase involved in cell wall biosynthesis